ncbi:hypothetical protein [Natrarchaeobius oligotrophus]|uniref:Uncharacterized protein n=1 Tax=Natrarchaeobius chitinivorans TaxID=1679083 RepID=A0A3N6MUW3_NATCH|nr:hypothetical protein [Natrarchaeobius chitinivorans]RQH01771.1 hypothetical protein EA472_05465 [Natrarchaeobius chitinivorans]
MSSSTDAAGSADDLADSVCDRCGDPVSRDRVIRLSSEPCPALEGRYVAVTKPYCPDCVAAVGMLELETRSDGEAG